MKKSYYNFNTLFRSEKINEKFVEGHVLQSSVMEKRSSKDNLLSIIFQRDSCGLPSGDLQYYISPKANPEVKQFILDNLMMDVSAAAAPKNSDIDDDTAFALMRQDGETVEQYMNRVNDFGRSNYDLVMAASKFDGNASSE